MHAADRIADRDDRPGTGLHPRDEMSGAAPGGKVVDADKWHHIIARPRHDIEHGKAGGRQVAQGIPHRRLIGKRQDQPRAPRRRPQDPPRQILGPDRIDKAAMDLHGCIQRRCDPFKGLGQTPEKRAFRFQ